MRKTLLLLVIIFFWFLPPAQAEIKTFVHTVRQPFSGSQSPDDARVAATHKAKREVLEKAGTYLQTLTVVEDGRLTKDQILALASGVLKTEIVSQKHYHTEEGFGIIIKAKMKVDTGVLEDSVKKLMVDRTAMDQFIAIRKREKELLDRVEHLEEANQRLAQKKETQTVKKKKDALKTDFQQATKELDAVALRSEAIKLMWKDGKHSNLRRGIELLDKAIELDPGDALTYGVRGAAYFQLNQFIKVIQNSDKAIELDPDFATAYAFRGLAYAKLNQPIKVIQDSDKAIELDPGSATAYAMRGKAYNHLNQPIRAIQDLDKAIELDPGNASAYNNRGCAYSNLNQYIRAIQDLDKVIELDPGSAQAYKNRGIVHINFQRISQGCADLKKACELGVCNGLEFSIKMGHCL